MRDREATTLGHKSTTTGEEMQVRSLLLGDTEGLTGSAGGLGLLTADLDAEVVTETSVLAGLLHALKIFSESGINHVGDQLGVGTVLDASLSVEEPLGHAVLDGLGHNVRNLINICLGELASALLEVDLGDLEDEDGEAATESLNDSQREGCLVLSVNVGVLHTQNVLEVISVLNYEARHFSLICLAELEIV